MANYRHGDITFHSVSEEEFNKLSKGAEKGQHKKNLDSFVVALGEATGHRHVITMERPKALEVVETADGVAFKLDSPGKISHEEHHTFEMEPGFYVRKIEQEYDPFRDQVRYALD